MDHLTIAPVEFKSLAICGIEGVNVSIIESTHTIRRGKPGQIRIDEHTVYHDTS